MTSPVDSRSDSTGTTVVGWVAPRTVTVTDPGGTGLVPAPTSTTIETCPPASGNTATVRRGTAAAGPAGHSPAAAAMPSRTTTARPRLRRDGVNDDIVPVAPPPVVEAAAAGHKLQGGLQGG